MTPMRAATLAAIAAAGLACGKGDAPPRRDGARRPPARPAPASAPADAGAGARAVALPPAPPVPPAPRGLPDTPSPLDNPTTGEKVALGQLLFFDPRLAADGATSCASCHDPAKGWADGRERAVPVAGKPNLRHTPSIAGVAYYGALYWDGRHNTLEELLPGHWEGQMAAVPDEVAGALDAVPEYRAHFARAFGGPSTAEGVVRALAAFVRTVRSGDSAYDRYEVAGDPTAAPPEAIAGFQVFGQKAQCALCHAPPLYTDSAYHAIGAGTTPDPGRALVTRRDSDVGRFRTPALRGVALTAPYFHDGRVASLREAVTTCLEATRGQSGGVVLSEPEIDQLVAFLHALSPPVDAARPALPPEPSAD